MKTLHRSTFMKQFSNGLSLRSSSELQTALRNENLPKNTLQWLDGDGNGRLEGHELAMLFQMLDHFDRNGDKHSIALRGRSGRLYKAFRKAAQDSPPTSPKTEHAPCLCSETPPKAPLSVVEIAKRYLGVRESNKRDDGPPSWLFSDGRREAWCANFVKTLFELSGNPLPGRWERLQSSSEMLRQLKSEGAYFPRGQKTPKPGDIVFFKLRKGPWPSTHVGIVEKVEGDRIVTIEGNYSNSVKRVTHHKNSRKIVGFGRWTQENRTTISKG
jgi:hypothetical protein